VRHTKTTARGRKIALGGAVAAAALAVGLGAAGPAGATQSPTASVEGDTLTVTGTGAADRIALRLQAGASGTLDVDFGDDGVAEHSFDRSTFGRIVVSALNGDDQFRVDQANGTFTDEALTVNGGQGDDILNGGDGIELFNGNGGDDTIDGNRGDDVARLGSGNDTFRWDPGDGSDTFEGDRGFDTLDFNGAGAPEVMSLSAEGERSVFLRDVANIRMDMGTVERLDLTTLGGADTFTLDNMSGTDFKRADVDLSGPAGGPDVLADTVTVNGTARGDEIVVTTPDGALVDVDGLKTQLSLRGSEPLDTLQLNGLDGDDDVSVDGAVEPLITAQIDLGADQRN
jgi:hypothetical protein